MKPSKYNLFISQGNDEFVVYNTLSDAIVVLNRRVKNCIQEGLIHEIDKENLNKLINCNIIIEEQVDEKKIIAYHYDLYKFKSSFARFLVLTTNRCNLACPYCYETPAAPRRAMDDVTADNLVRFIRSFVEERRHKRVLLGLYGGEPLLNPDCCYRICDKLRSWTQEKDILLDVILTTNGTLLTEEVIGRLSPLSSVHVTLDGPKDLHNKKRFHKDGSGTYDKIIDAVRLLREKRISTSIRLNIARDSLHALPSLLLDLKAFLKSDGVRVYAALLEKPCNTIGCGDHDMSYIQPDEIEEVMDKLSELGEESGFDTGPEKDGPCSMFSDWTFTIDPSGSIYKCFEMAGLEQYSVGAIQNGGTVKWKYAYFDQMTYSPLQFPKCKECIYLPKCFGGCPKDAQDRTVGSSTDCRIAERKRRASLIRIKKKIEGSKIEAVKI